jgi:hypothetical protein
MVRRTAEAVAAFAVCAVGVYIVGCDGATGPGEFGHAELIYELEADDMNNITLADASAYGDMYLLRTYNYGTKERGLWYVEPPNDEPTLIGVSKANWWGSPKLSPDKENVVFEEKSGIYVAPVNGGEPRLVYGQGLDPTPAQWIDDETVLIYVIINYWEIKTVNINTLEVNTLLVHDESTGGGGINSTSLSPDGKYLFLTGDRREGDEFSPKYYFFQIFDTETWEYKEYITDCTRNGAWSSDGTKISVMGHSDPSPEG